MIRLYKRKSYVTVFRWAWWLKKDTLMNPPSMISGAVALLPLTQSGCPALLQVTLDRRDLSSEE